MLQKEFDSPRRRLMPFDDTYELLWWIVLHIGSLSERVRLCWAAWLHNSKGFARYVHSLSQKSTHSGPLCLIVPVLMVVVSLRELKRVIS